MDSLAIVVIRASEDEMAAHECVAHLVDLIWELGKQLTECSNLLAISS